MKTLIISLLNNRHGNLVPPEDAYAVKGGVVCVADGITRDPLIDPDWRGVDTEEALRHYPNPSPAAEAARFCCQTFVNSQAGTALKRLKQANTAIASLNERLSVII